MKTTLFKRALAVLLAGLFLFSGVPAAAAEENTFRCEKTAVMQPDGTAQITLRAYQTGRVAAADIVLVLDVSGSMEKSTPVALEDIDPAKDYYIRYKHYVKIDGEMKVKQEDILVHNTAPEGEAPTWYGRLEPDDAPTLIVPGDGLNGTYVFYTGAMEALRAAAGDFVQSVAQNAADVDADHRIAVVEFSSPEKKYPSSLGTHALPYYANILTGDHTAAGALVSAKDDSAQLLRVFADLTADGPTYSDDAMAQAEAILSASDAERRMAILFTDGGPGSYGWQYDNDNSALLTANGAIAAASRMKRSGAKVYTIGVFNEENLAGTTGEQNRTYLSLLSSNYPQSNSMSDGGEKVSDGYCSIGDLNMDLSGVFRDITAVLGNPVERAQIVDTVSEYFYLTDAQRQALAAACPGVQITGNADGTTRIMLSDVDFPPVAVLGNGKPADPQDSGIFTMTFSATRREGFLGGKAIRTNSGDCGVYADGVQLASFPTPQVDVPVSEALLANLVQPKSVGTVYNGQTLRAADFYRDASAQADGAAVRYTVLDPNGKAFTETEAAVSGDYVVRVTAVIDGETYTSQKTVPIEVLPDETDRLVLDTRAAKTKYVVGQSPELSGLGCTAMMKSGKSVSVQPGQLSVSPAVFTETGTQLVTVEYEGKSQTFSVQVAARKAEKAEVIQTPKNNVFTYRTKPDFSGLAVRVTYNDGTQQTVLSLSEMSIRAESAARVRRGAQTFRVTTQGVSATFTMQSKLVWWQWLILIFLFGWIWY